MCNTTINSTASMEGNPLDWAKTACEEDPTEKYEEILAKFSEAAKEIPECSEVPAYFAEHQRNIDPRDFDWLTKEGLTKLTKATKANAVKFASQIEAWSNPRRRRRKSEGNPEGTSLYYMPTDMPMSMEPLSRDDTNLNASASINLFSSPSSMTPTYSAAPYTSSPSYTFQSVGTDETSESSEDDTDIREGRHYGFCTAPPPVSASHTSESSNSDVDSYYSIDDGDLRDDGDDTYTYGRQNDKSKTRRLRFAAY